MRLLTTKEALDRISLQNRPIKAIKDLYNDFEGETRERFEVRWNFLSLPHLTNLLEDFVRPYEQAVITVEDWSRDAWTENFYLYETLRRQSDNRGTLEDLSSHLFHHFEFWEVRSYLAVMMMNGWDFYCTTTSHYSRIHFHHDGFVTAWANTPQAIAELRTALQRPRS